MKKYLLPVFCWILIAFAAAEASALDMTIGATGGYNWWNPAWNNGKIVLQRPDLMMKFVYDNFPRFSSINNFMCGPDVSLSFLNRWDLALAFRYGFARSSAHGFGNEPGNPGLSPADMSNKNHLKQYGLDAKIKYSVLSFMGIFAALRYQLFNCDVFYKQITFQSSNPGFFSMKLKGNFMNYTPEIGLSFFIPFSEIFTALFDLSGTFQSGSSKMRFVTGYSLQGLTTDRIIFPRDRYYAAGLNASADLKIKIPKTGMAITLGGYYRFLSYMQAKKDRGFFSIDGAADHTYGIRCSASYSFSIVVREKRSLWVPRPEGSGI